MAKTSMIEREKKRSLLVQKHAKKRAALKVLICSPHSSDQERVDAERMLQKLPRDSSRSRQRNRCSMCGRSRAYNRLTGLCRLHMRKIVMNGHAPGVGKASW